MRRASLVPAAVALAGACAALALAPLARIPGADVLLPLLAGLALGAFLPPRGDRPARLAAWASLVAAGGVFALPLAGGFLAWGSPPFLVGGALALALRAAGTTRAAASLPLGGALGLLALSALLALDVPVPPIVPAAGLLLAGVLWLARDASRADDGAAEPAGARLPAPLAALALGGLCAYAHLRLAPFWPGSPCAALCVPAWLLLGVAGGLLLGRGRTGVRLLLAGVLVALVPVLAAWLPGVLLPLGRSGGAALFAARAGAAALLVLPAALCVGGALGARASGGGLGLAFALVVAGAALGLRVLAPESGLLAGAAAALLLAVLCEAQAALERGRLRWVGAALGVVALALLLVPAARAWFAGRTPTAWQAEVAAAGSPAWLDVQDGEDARLYAALRDVARRSRGDDGSRAGLELLGAGEASTHLVDGGPLPSVESLAEDLAGLAPDGVLLVRVALARHPPALLWRALAAVRGAGAEPLGFLYDDHLVVRLRRAGAVGATVPPAAWKHLVFDAGTLAAGPAGGPDPLRRGASTCAGALEGPDRPWDARAAREALLQAFTAHPPPVLRRAGASNAASVRAWLDEERAERALSFAEAAGIGATVEERLVLSRALRAAGQRERAVGGLQGLAAQHPDDGEVVAAWILAASDALPTGESARRGLATDAQRAAERLPADGRVQAALAHLAMALGEVDFAIAAFDRAVAATEVVAPPGTGYRLARILLSTGRATPERLLELLHGDPGVREDPEALDLAMRMEARLGDVERSTALGRDLDALLARRAGARASAAWRAWEEAAPDADLAQAAVLLAPGRADLQELLALSLLGAARARGVEVDATTRYAAEGALLRAGDLEPGRDAARDRGILGWHGLVPSAPEAAAPGDGGE